MLQRRHPALLLSLRSLPLLYSSKEEVRTRRRVAYVRHQRTSNQMWRLRRLALVLRRANQPWIIGRESTVKSSMPRGPARGSPVKFKRLYMALRLMGVAMGPKRYPTSPYGSPNRLVHLRHLHHPQLLWPVCLDWFLRVWSPSRFYNTIKQFIRGLVPKKLPVLVWEYSQGERETVSISIYKFYLTKIDIIFDAHTPIFAFFLFT